MSRMLAALKRLEGRRPPRAAVPARVEIELARDSASEDAVHEAAAVEVEVVDDHSEDPTELELVAEIPLPPVPDVTRLTIEPAAVVTASEVVRGEFVEFPSDILEQIETLAREVVEFHRESAAQADERTADSISTDEPDFDGPELPALNTAGRDPHLGPYRLLRDRILSERSASGPTMLLFTTSDHAGLEPFSLWQLAETFGEQGAGEVLLVDADPEHPLEIPSTVSLSEVGLEGALQGKQTWADIVRKTPAYGVSLVAQGPNAVRIESSEVSLWDELRQQFRVVLVHAGPAGAAATLWLAPLCDATYLVISLDRTQRADALKAQTALRACGANLAGTIVTGRSAG